MKKDTNAERERVLRSLISGADYRAYSAPNYAMKCAAEQYAFDLRQQLYTETGKDAPRYD